MLMDMKNNPDFTLNNMFIASFNMFLLIISKQCKPWSCATFVVFDHGPYCWQQLVYKWAQDLGEGGIAALMYLVFTFGSVVH